MDSFKKLLCWISVLALLAILSSGCTKKNNLTGNNWSDTNALTVNDTLGVTMGYSFPAETLSEPKGTETKILVADYASATAISYIRFTGLPASNDIVDLEAADSCYVTVNIMKRSPLRRDNLKLQLYKVNKAWPDTLGNLTEADLSIIPGAEYTVDDTIATVGKQIKLPIPISAIYDWECAEDSTGWNMAIKAVESGWVELASSETTTGPTLFFKYKKANDTTFSTYNSEATKDSYVLNAPLGSSSAAWKLDNLTSTRMFVKFLPNNTLFKDKLGNPLDTLTIKRMTINKASLVLYIKNNTYYSGASTYYLFPFNVVKDSITDITPLVKADYETIVFSASSFGLVDGDSLEIDITPIVQAYTSGDKTPLGIMLQSLQERQNFGSIEFWDNLSATPEDKRPFVKITYTPPFL